MGLVAGSLEIPRNDDWVYRRIAVEFAQTGVLALHSVTTMMVGQIVITQPFLWLLGPQPWAFVAAGVMFAIAAVVCSYVLARQFVPPLRAALATVLLLLFPAYLAYATSFMTDVPAIAAQFACLALGAIALRGGPIETRWLLASAAVGCLAFSIREFAIAAPASVLIAVICAEPRQRRHWMLAMAVICCFALLYLLKATLPGQDLGSRIGYGALSQSTYALSTLSLVLLPAAVIGGARWRRHWKPKDVGIGAEFGLLVVGIRVFQWIQDGTMPDVLMGNLASPWGAPAASYVIGDRPHLFSTATWAIVGLLALVATVVVSSVAAGIAGAYVRQGRGSSWAVVHRLGSPTGLLLLFAVALVVGLSIYGIKFPLYDRYYWPLVPVAATLFMYRPCRDVLWSPVSAPRWKIACPVSVAAVLSVLSIFSMIFMLNSFAFDSARWSAGERLVEAGVRPEEIDAGYEWVGYHQPLLPIDSGMFSIQTFYATLWPGRRVCGIVTSEMNSAAGATLVGTVSYQLSLIAGPEEQLYLYHATGTDCMRE